ncbi:MAG: hypothetical protein ACX94B_11275 [Henriciella sp.]|nr:hypothetical protein [Hyphomonadaceae bacterium]
MTYSTDHEIEALTNAFLARTLPKSAWTHAAHFAAALCLLKRPGVDPFREMPGFIRAYNETTGVANTETEGYHETITLACLRAAKWFLDQRTMDTPLTDVLAAIMASPLGRSDWLSTYWSRAVLFSPRARRLWVEPDLRPLPY